MRLYVNRHGRVGISYGWFGMLMYAFGWLMIWTLIIAVVLAGVVIYALGRLVLRAIALSQQRRGGSSLPPPQARTEKQAAVSNRR